MSTKELTGFFKNKKQVCKNKKHFILILDNLGISTIIIVLSGKNFLVKKEIVDRQE